ncbi:3-coathanger stack domain-containing protein [Runella aurantiaca]|uniref:Delta-60 repeat protein n=1 Tax=Runella aurantiaca TaxID=2282308 RepID=A0A369ICV1_9BACT|nr:3-coathanger stack domain-containing protein [Runella aurantiaca]RDB06872.1 hypothetical protein DVG78_06190 [Runella aurantiaca]
MKTFITPAYYAQCLLRTIRHQMIPLCWLLFYFQTVQAQVNGALDVDFSTNGKNSITFPGASNGIEFALGSALQSDGKIVVVGSSNGGLATIRLLPNGTLDNTFSTDGKVVFSYSGLTAQANAVAIQSDGKIVVVGQVHDTSDPNKLYDFVILRYLPNGNIDNTFNGTGSIRTHASLNDFYYDVAVQTDGKIVVAGSQNSQFVVRRYLSTGTLDADFGSAGTVFGVFQGVARGVALQPDGKIVVGGYTWEFMAPDRDFGVMRLNANGTLDNTFDTDGKAITDIGNSTDDYAYDLAVQEDGKIVLAGKIWNGTSDDVALVRYNENGSLDLNFNDTGKQTTSINPGDDRGNAITLQPNGDIVVGGTTRTPAYSYEVILLDGTRAIIDVPANDDFVVLVYQSDGDLNTLFSGDGIRTIPFTEGKHDKGNTMLLQNDGKIIVAGSVHNGTNEDFGICRLHGFYRFYTLENRLYLSFGDEAEQARCMVVQPDEKILVAGYTTSSAAKQFAIARYLRSGALDETFSGDGKLIISSTILPNEAYANAIALQPDGKIVVAGQAYNGTDSDFAVIRLLPDGTTDNTFGTNGKVLVNIFGLDYCKAMALQPDGKIVLAGYSISTGGIGIYKSTVARLLPNGTLDVSFDTDGKVELGGTIGTDEINSVHIFNNKIIISGYELNQDFVAYRLNADGSLDNTFDGDGKAVTDFGMEQALGWCSAIQPDGKLIIGGRLALVSGVMVLVRYNVDGSLDNTFSGDGIYTSTSYPADNRAYAIKVLASGKILVGGDVFGLNTWSKTLLRVNANGTTDLNFGFNGAYTFPNLGYEDDRFGAMALGNYDRVYVAGSYDNGTNFDMTLSIFLQCKLNPQIVSLTHPNDDISLNRINNPETGKAIQATNWVLGTANVACKAKDFIELKPGFKVEPGAVFKAEMGLVCSYTLNPNDP